MRAATGSTKKKQQRRQEKKGRKDQYLAQVYSQKEEEAEKKREVQAQLDLLRKQEHARLEEEKKELKCNSIPTNVLHKWSYKNHLLAGSIWMPEKKAYDHKEFDILEYCRSKHSVKVKNNSAKLFLEEKHKDSFYKKKDFFAILEKECTLASCCQDKICD